MLRVREMDIEFYRHYANALEAAQPPAWRYNEMKPCGFNYNNFILARVYDTYHQMFRDYRRESERIIDLLGLSPTAAVLDMGCGTGAFALHAATYYESVHAVDVSKAMLGRARRKAKKANLKNIQFHLGGFLTYEHRAAPVDAISTSVALHHLPDFWKFVGLTRLAAMLKSGGRLYLFDVVFSFEIAQYESCFNQFIKQISVQMGPNGEAESQTHLRDEFSTCDWIMEGMLERAGFVIDTREYHNGFLAAYVCTKKHR